MDVDGTRKPVSKRLRFEIFRRDNFTCRYCGLHAGEDGAELTVDHVTPYALGGTNDPTNLVTACKDCNAGKSSVQPGSPVVDDVTQDALRWASAMERAATIRSDEAVRRNRYIEQALDHWTCFKSGGQYRVPHPHDARRSLEMFFSAGLPFQVLLDAIEKAMAASHVVVDQKWRYMCGVAWRSLAEIQEAAKAIIAAEGDA